MNKKLLALLKRWYDIRYRLDGCHLTDCTICAENKKLFADTLAILTGEKTDD